MLFFVPEDETTGCSERVCGVALMEALLPPGLPLPVYDAMGKFTGTMFKALRTLGLGEDLVFHHNFLVETVLGRFGSGRILSDAKNLASSPLMNRCARSYQGKLIANGRPSK